MYSNRHVDSVNGLTPAEAIAAQRALQQCGNHTDELISGELINPGDAEDVFARPENGSRRALRQSARKLRRSNPERITVSPAERRERGVYPTFKTTFDFVGSLTLLVAVAPVLPVIYFVVKCASPGPAIFRQKRLTESGREFTLYKFRTMRVDAENGSGAVWAQENDPRVTRVGSFLRTTRLDELPQLFNVLKGEMSLIGPRPERPELAQKLEHQIPGFHRRLRVKAGLTGLAQVGSGYSACEASHRRKLAWDRLYIQRRSVPLDLWIALKTVAIVVSGRGAR